jgi:phosphate uptake regulator
MDIREAREIREVLREINSYSLKDLKRERLKLEVATAEAKRTLSDIHSATKDARATLKEAQTFLNSAIKDLMLAQVDEHMGILRDATNLAREEAVDRIIREFERLGNLLLTADGQQPIEEIITLVFANPGQGIVSKQPTHWRSKQ